MMQFLKKSKTLNIIMYLALMYYVGGYLSSGIGSNPFLELNDGPIPDVNSGKETNDPITGLAFSVCKKRILNDLGAIEANEFATDTYDEWNLTGGGYLIKSVVYTSNDAGLPERQNYACRIQSLGQDYNDPSNWVIQSIDMQAS